MRKSEIVVGPTGGISHLRRCSGPLKAGETTLRIEVIQPEGAVLDEKRLELLRRQAEVFFSTLNDGVRAGDGLLIERLKREVMPETWNTLLAVGSERAYWLIQAWTAEARLVLERQPPADPSFDAEGSLSMLMRWANALQFPDIIGFRKIQQADWRHVAANARAQADFCRRRAKHLKPGARSGGPRHLLPRLRARLARGQRLLILGLKDSSPIFDATAHDLLDRYAELVLADSAEDGLRSLAPEISNKGYAAVLILPGLPPGLAEGIERVCSARGLVYSRLTSDGLEDLDRSLAILDSILQEKG